ncbi:hypothetical protein [Crassaminicella profunda]|jgi:hypothetical protein|nr:hypothetical protein [Crassaminicella profunda]
MENLFDNFFQDSWFAPMNIQRGQMKVDIKENEKEYNKINQSI